MAALLLTIRPNLAGANGFLRWAAYHREPTAIVSAVDTDPVTVTTTLAEELVHRSMLAVGKYRRVRLAVHLLLAGLGFLGLALLVA